MDVFVREGSSSEFLSPELAISTSPCFGRFKVKEWLQERHSKHWAAAPGTRQSKLFIGRPLDKLSRLVINRVVNWTLYTEVASTYRGPPGQCKVQEMQTGGGILLPYTLSMPRVGWA
jgi:hypothetical protein